MPLYTYRCDHCGVQFDRRQHFNDPVLEVCPECGEKALRKIYLPVGIVFKGSGFYSTDHRATKGLGTAKTPDEKASTPSADKESTKTTKEASKETD